MTRVQITDTLSISDRQPLTLIGGLCVIESEDLTLKMSEEIRLVCDRLALPYYLS